MTHKGSGIRSWLRKKFKKATVKKPASKLKAPKKTPSGRIVVNSRPVGDVKELTKKEGKVGKSQLEKARQELMENYEKNKNKLLKERGNKLQTLVVRKARSTNKSPLNRIINSRPIYANPLLDKKIIETENKYHMQTNNNLLKQAHLEHVKLLEDKNKILKNKSDKLKVRSKHLSNKNKISLKSDKMENIEEKLMLGDVDARLKCLKLDLRELNEQCVYKKWHKNSSILYSNRENYYITFYTLVNYKYYYNLLKTKYKITELYQCDQKSFDDSGLPKIFWHDYFLTNNEPFYNNYTFSDKLFSYNFKNSLMISNNYSSFTHYKQEKLNFFKKLKMINYKIIPYYYIPVQLNIIGNNNHLTDSVREINNESNPSKYITGYNVNGCGYFHSIYEYGLYNHTVHDLFNIIIQEIMKDNNNIYIILFQIIYTVYCSVTNNIVEYTDFLYILKRNSEISEYEKKKYNIFHLPNKKKVYLPYIGIELRHGTKNCGLQIYDGNLSDVVLKETKYLDSVSHVIHTILFYIYNELIMKNLLEKIPEKIQNNVFDVMFILYKCYNDDTEFNNFKDTLRKINKRDFKNMTDEQKEINNFFTNNKLPTSKSADYIKKLNLIVDKINELFPERTDRENIINEFVFSIIDDDKKK